MITREMSPPTQHLISRVPPPNKLLNIDDDPLGSIWGWLKFQRDCSLIKCIHISTVLKQYRTGYKNCDGNTVNPDFLPIVCWQFGFPSKCPFNRSNICYSFRGCCALSSYPLSTWATWVILRPKHLMKSAHVIEEFGEDCIYHSRTKVSVSYINWIWSRSSGVAFAEELLTLYWVQTQSPASLFRLKKMAVAGVILRCDVTTLFFCWVGGGGDVGSGQWSPPTRHYGSWGRGRGSPRLGISWRGAEKTFFGSGVWC